MVDPGTRPPTVEAAGHGRRTGIDLVTAGLIAFGVYHLALGLFMVVAPGTFFAEVGPFGVRNDHYIRDTATFNLAFGVVLVAAVRYGSWRVPVLVAVLLQFALHTANHLVDIGEADPAWVGAFDFVALLIATALLAGLLRATLRDSAEPGAGSKETGGPEARP